jgi:hypothetical protein
MLVRENKDVVLENNQQVANFLSIPAFASLVPVDPGVAPERQE